MDEIQNVSTQSGDENQSGVAVQDAGDVSQASGTFPLCDPVCDHGVDVDFVQRRNLPKTPLARTPMRARITH